MNYTELASKLYLNSGLRFQRRIIWAMGLIKYASAKANIELGLLDQDIGKIIMEISAEIMNGKHDDKVSIDVFGSGSGTGLNMNINELVSLIAKIRYGVAVHPNDHVNLGQSSNDVIPSAIRIAAMHDMDRILYPALLELRNSLKKFINKYGGYIKAGRTHLRDALPITFKQEFSAYLIELEELIDLYKVIVKRLGNLPIGGTAVGTGVNTHPDFPDKVIHIIKNITKLPIRRDKVFSRRMKLHLDLVSLSNYIRMISILLFRLSQDIRIMFSGPNTGFNEIDIEMKLPGSSIMPGKKNPVTAEAVQLASSYIIGLDASILQTSLLGELELSMGNPLIGYSIILQIKLCGEALEKIAKELIPRIKVNKDLCREQALNSQALITFLTPIIGYDNASILLEKIRKGYKIDDILRELGFRKRDIKRILNPKKLTKMGYIVEK